MIRVIALITAGFLFLSTVEVAWSFYALAGRWLISSRFATLSLAVVKRWLDRGLITTGTQWVKTFIQRNGKMILMTLAVSEVLKELSSISANQGLCYVPSSQHGLLAGFNQDGSFSVPNAYSRSAFSYSVSGQNCVNTNRVPAYPVYKLYNGYWWYVGDIPASGTYPVGMEYSTGRPCYVTFTVNIPQCSFSAGSSPVPASSSDVAVPNLEQERRQVPVEVYPNPADFVRSDVISKDPALSWLQDRYQTIANDPSVPVISSDALDGVELPSVDWSIPPEEAIDSSAESSQDAKSQTNSNSTASDKSSDQSLDVSVPGFDTGLNIPAKKSFPVELVNSIVQNHPLLRVLRNIGLDVGSGDCVIGSEPFVFDFCRYGWVLNVMGGVITFVAFLTGLFWVGRSEE